MFWIGHLIASHFGSAGDKVNLVPMTRVLNRVDCRDMERELGKYLDEGKSVSIKVDVSYPSGETVTPNALRVSAWLDGVLEAYPLIQRVFCDGC